MPDAQGLYREVSGLLFGSDYGGAAAGGDDEGNPEPPTARRPGGRGRRDTAPIPDRRRSNEPRPGGCRGPRVRQAEPRCGSTCTPTPRCPTAPRPRPSSWRRRGPPGWTSSRSPTTTRPTAGRRPRRPGRAGLTVVPGMELSCRWFPADQPPISVHLLAYLFDPEHPGLAAERAPAARRAARPRRADRPGAGRRRLSRSSGSRSSPGCAGGVVGRPHIARALVDAGVVESVDEAFATLLHHRSPYYVAKADTDVREGIALVRAAGGVPVFAHGLATTRGRVVGDDAVAAMAEAGLLGLEVDHPDHTPDAARPPARPGRRPRPDPHRVQRLPRHQQADADRRLHHRARAVRGAAGRRHGQRALPRLTRNRRTPRLPWPACGTPSDARAGASCPACPGGCCAPRPSRWPTSPTAPAATATPTSTGRRRPRARGSPTTRSARRCTQALSLVVGPAGRAAHDRRRRASCSTRPGRRPASATPSSPSAGARGPPAG